MKLTPELIAQSPSYINPLKDRELDLRGHKIPVIENLGVTKDQHDTIDLTDNSLTHLQNLPLLRRLTTLLVPNNRISFISRSLSASAPKLKTLVLTNNALSELGDLAPLGSLNALEYLTLLGNPVREKKHYREWVIFNCKSLRVLDFQRVHEKEKKQAQALFLTSDGLPTALASSLSSSVTTNAPASKTFVPGGEEPIGPSVKAGDLGRRMTEEEKERIKVAIQNATSVEEVRRLEKSLRDGFVPT